MGTSGKWLTGIIILAIVAAIIHFFTPWGAKAHSVNMGNSVSAALQDAGLSGVDVDMQGNVAKLSGELRDESTKAAAISTAENAQCEKCADREAGKRWHEVDGSGLEVKAPIVSPYTLTGNRTDNGGIVLNGYARNDAQRQQIIADAEAAFMGKVTDNKIKIAEGAPYPGWDIVAKTNIAGLASLENGSFTMNDASSVLTGRAATTEQRSAVNAALAGLPKGYAGSSNITVPNAAADNVGQITSESICQDLFNSLKGDSKINFSYNRAEIRDQASRSILDAMVSAANQCSSFRIAVEGHTDADGAEAYNQNLSLQRAQAVVAYLVSAGVNEANVKGYGYGESRPIASNDTPTGMAQNRRIEFKVTQTQ